MRCKLCGWFAAIAVSVVLMYSVASAANDDDRIVAAREAFMRGDRARLATLLDSVRGHELEPYVQYWALTARLDETSDDAVLDFLQRNAGTVLAERLRADWLKQLGKRHQWDTFDREYRALTQPDVELVCYALQSRLAEQDDSALDEARPLWFNELDLPSSCSPLVDAMITDGRIDTDDVWQRMRRLLEAKRFGQAKLAAAWLPTDQAPEPKLLDRIADAPQRYLDKLKPNFATSRLGREMAMYAIQRLARSDAEQAAAEWEPIKGRFSAAERGYVYVQLAWQGARQHLPQALGWYKAAGDTPLSDEQMAWKARAALRGLDWKQVRSAIEVMPTRLADKPDWQYWLGRALQAQGKREEAQALFERISGQPNFYSNLADDELGRPITVPPRAAQPTGEEIAAAASVSAIRRAVSLLRLDMRIEALREWSAAVRGMDDRQLLAAAEFARRNELFDRAINAADRTQFEHDFNLRYLAPFRDRIEPAVRELDLDQAWVYGLMRQESRFVMNARSGAGASGLMQLMPATAKLVAKKIGLKDFRPSSIADVEVNVALGINYLKMVLDDLDNHPVLASAAYNAGPNRARKWRDIKPLEGAIYAETIPFSETRDYVKKVMSNAVYYSALFEGKPQSLKSRLGVVSSRNGDNGGSGELGEPNGDPQ